MSNKVIYNGNVKIKINNKKQKTKKNSGTTTLFNTLCELLLDPTNKENAQKAPQYITLRTNPESSTSSLLTRSLLIVDKHMDTSTPTLILSAHLANDVCVSIDLKNSPDKCHVVLLDGLSRVLASVEIIFDDIETVFKSVNAQAEIVWEMSFSNSTQDDTTTNDTTQDDTTNEGDTQ